MKRLLILAFIPGLCDKPEDPSRGVPPEIWNLRQVMEREVTREEKTERVTGDQLRRMRAAADAVFTFGNVQNADAEAEVVYLLPRTWHWEQRQALRDLLVLLIAPKGGAVMSAENVNAQETGFRKTAFQRLKKLHEEVAPLDPASRVERVKKLMESKDWADEKIGGPDLFRYGKGLLLHDYAAMVAADAGDAGVQADLARDAGPHQSWTLVSLARNSSPRAGAVLREFYGESAADGDGARAAAIRFWATLADPKSKISAAAAASESGYSPLLVEGERAWVLLDVEAPDGRLLADVALVRRDGAWAAASFRALERPRR